jgi:hypothetical protein
MNKMKNIDQEFLHTLHIEKYGLRTSALNSSKRNWLSSLSFLGLDP